MTDPVTQALTGVLSACVIAGGVLAYPVARLLLCSPSCAPDGAGR